MVTKATTHIQDSHEPPFDWRVLPFEDCILMNIERKTSVQQGQYKPIGRYPIVDQGNSLIAGYTDDENIVHQDDLPIILFGDHTRIFKFLDFPFAAGADGTKLFRANDQIVDPKFLYYALLHIDIPSRGYNRHFKYLREKTIAVPTESKEQRAIAVVLSKIQAAVEVQDKIVATLKELKATTMAKLFREGLRGEPLKQTEIGEMPENWEVVRVGDLLKLRSGERRPNDLSPSYSETTPCPVYGGNGVMGYSSQFLTSWESIIIGRVGAYSGSVHVCPPRSWVTDNALYHRDPVGNRASLQYLAELLTYLRLNRLQRKSAQPLVTQGIVHILEIPLPSKPEQKEIANVATLLKKQCETAEYRLEILKSLFSSMLHLLMTGQVRVNHLKFEEGRHG